MATNFFAKATTFFGAFTSTDEERLELFRIVYKENNEYVRRTLYWLGAGDSTDDLVQEVFLKVWKNLKQFENRSNIKTWIYRISVNTAYDNFRKNRQKFSEYKDSAGTASDFEITDVIKKGIAQLNEKLRPVFVFYYYQDLSIKDIAESLNLAEGTVKSRLHTARALFCDFLQQQGVRYE